MQKVVQGSLSSHNYSLVNGFERAKQLAGFGDFEVRKYLGLIRHWLCSRIVMYFLAVQTARLRGEKYADHVRAGRGCLPVAAGEDRQLLAEIVA